MEQEERGEFSGRFWPWRSFSVGQGTHNSIFSLVASIMRSMRGVQEATRVVWTTLLPVEDVEKRVNEGRRGGGSGGRRTRRTLSAPSRFIITPFRFFSLSPSRDRPTDWCTRMEKERKRRDAPDSVDSFRSRRGEDWIGSKENYFGLFESYLKVS